MTAITPQAVYAALEPANRRVAFYRAKRILPRWMTADDLEQIGWQVCAELAHSYVPQAGVPLSHYVGASFPWTLYRRVKQGGDIGRSPRALVWSRPHAIMRTEMEQAPETPDYALAVACADLLTRLPAPERRALWLTAVEGLSFTHVAVQMGVPRSTAFVLYHRAIAQARAFWDGEAA